MPAIGTYDVITSQTVELHSSPALCLPRRKFCNSVFVNYVTSQSASFGGCQVKDVSIFWSVSLTLNLTLCPLLIKTRIWGYVVLRLLSRRWNVKPSVYFHFSISGQGFKKKIEWYLAGWYFFSVIWLCCWCDLDVDGLIQQNVPLLSDGCLFEAYWAQLMVFHLKFVYTQSEVRGSQKRWIFKCLPVFMFVSGFITHNR